MNIFRGLFIVALIISYSLLTGRSEAGSGIEYENSFSEPSIEKTLIVEFRESPSANIVKKINSIDGIYNTSSFDDIDSPYFRRLYRLKIEKNASKKDIKNTLKNLNFIKSIEDVFEVPGMSLKPSNDPSPFTDDPLFNYQWGLFNNNQVLYRDIDDIHSEKIRGKQGIDIGWKGIYEETSSLMKKDVVVAVLDSGLDLEHPEIKDSIYKNDLECNNGTLPFRPKEDKDENGYVGDCMGWNFTSKKEEGGNRPYDDSPAGHGTHVAGIIASSINNGQGISGLSERIKILPIKVLAAKGKKSAIGLDILIKQRFKIKS